MTARGKKKHPALTRSQLLKAALEIAVQKGISAVTLDAVAAHSGISKGGLQYHFRTKVDLLDALFEEAMATSDTESKRWASEDPEPFGRMERVYLRGALQDASQNQAAWRVLLAAMLVEPELRNRWSNQLRLTDDNEEFSLEDRARLLISNLAAQGLWVVGLLGTFCVDQHLKEETLRQLDEMTRVSHKTSVKEINPSNNKSEKNL